MHTHSHTHTYTHTNKHHRSNYMTAWNICILNYLNAIGLVGFSVKLCWNGRNNSCGFVCYVHRDHVGLPHMAIYTKSTSMFKITSITCVDITQVKHKSHVVVNVIFRSSGVRCCYSLVNVFFFGLNLTFIWHHPIHFLRILQIKVNNTTS